jgi:hypothetical protein
MDMFDFAGLLFGGPRTATDATTVTATGAGASADGEVGITLDADVTPAEDTGVDGDTDQTIIDLPTSPDVDEGDELIVTLVGDGPLKPPVVTANPGSGDRMRVLANSAKTIADAAQAVAQAVNQHFFADDGGIHVTEATQEDWNTNHSGANVLINALGQLFRDGTNNLLALLPAHYRTDEFTGDGTAVAFTLSVTPYEVTSVSVNGITLTDEDWSASGDVVTLTTAPADGDAVSVTYRTSSTSIGIFDGRGNQSSNVVAEFSEDGVTVGRASSLNSFFDSVGIYFRDGVNNLLSLVAGKRYYHERNVTYGSTPFVLLGYYPVSIISVTLDGVEIDGYEVHGRYVTITEEYSGTKVCRVVYRSSPTLNMFAGDGSSDLVAQFSANLVQLARGGFKINVSEMYSGEWTGSMSLAKDAQHGGGISLGVRSDESSYTTLDVVGKGGSGAIVLGSDGSLDFSHLRSFVFLDGTVTTKQALVALRSPVGTYTGANGTATASAAGWQLTYFNVVVAEQGAPRSNYYTFSNGVLTATRDCVLEISGVMNWTDALAGNRGFGVFEGTTAGSGTEHSAFQNFPSGVSNRKSVVFPPKLFKLSAGSSLTFGRYQQQGAVYQNGTNFSWVTIRVVG